jgi:excisionase family DNA binding protein
MRVTQTGTVGLLDETPGAMLADMSDRPITPAEAAEELGVSRTVIYRFIKQGRVTVVAKYGPNYLLDRASLENVRERKPGYPKGRPRGGSD